MKGKMRAAVFEKVGTLVVKDVDVPKIQKGDDLICEVETCSVCGTDVHIMSVPPGYVATPGTILGHELVARIVEKGPDVKSLKVGQRVVVNPNNYCGVCRYCRLNLPNECENIIPMGIGADGGFAEYVRMSERVAFPVSDALPADIAGFAEPLACAVNGMNKIRANPGDSVVIIGGGPIALMFIKLMKACGASPIIVSEPVELRRKFAKDSGADVVVDPTKSPTALKDAVEKATGIGADIAIEVVGTQVAAALDVIRKGGKVLLFGINMKATATVSPSAITVKEAQLLGTWLANASFPRAVEILEKGIIDLKPLITHHFPLEKTAEAIEVLRKGEGVKVFIDPKS
jgi:2-desacetyl-2-hydroxyethyl bacteriochlorophyllide A dehydrogenase